MGDKGQGGTRRDLLIGLGATGLSLAAGVAQAGDRPVQPGFLTTACQNTGVRISNVRGRLAQPADFVTTQACTISRRGAEGPFFICSDVTTGRDIAAGLPGQAMTLALRVTDPTCAPIPNAIVDVWHCDARGNYSGHALSGDGGTLPGLGRRTPDAPTRFLRGVLATDADGIVEFDAIYPGFYAGRAIHTHFKVHLGNKVFLTSQALYPEDWNSRVMASPIYSDGRGVKRVSNKADLIGGSAGRFAVQPRGHRLLATLSLTLRA